MRQLIFNETLIDIRQCKSSCKHGCIDVINAKMIFCQNRKISFVLFVLFFSYDLVVSTDMYSIYSNFTNCNSQHLQFIWCYLTSAATRLISHTRRIFREKIDESYCRIVKKTTHFSWLHISIVSLEE